MFLWLGKVASRLFDAMCTQKPFQSFNYVAMQFSRSENFTLRQCQKDRQEAYKTLVSYVELSRNHDGIEALACTHNLHICFSKELGV